uniref:Uncharacterized protein n=2 Tax=Picea TaxID=3328 RepID=A0A101LX49_PICGL|nr:hypothetical protein ABT39_MTgene5996 [Picea glauca]QHR91458.1 hypothetical protein Q903MT_gene5492 [Picea sitchensis]
MHLLPMPGDLDNSGAGAHSYSAHGSRHILSSAWWHLSTALPGDGHFLNRADTLLHTAYYTWVHMLLFYFRSFTETRLHTCIPPSDHSHDTHRTLQHPDGA